MKSVPIFWERSKRGKQTTPLLDGSGAGSSRGGHHFLFQTSRISCQKNLYLLFLPCFHLADTPPSRLSPSPSTHSYTSRASQLLPHFCLRFYLLVLSLASLTCLFLFSLVADLWYYGFAYFLFMSNYIILGTIFWSCQS